MSTWAPCEGGKPSPHEHGQSRLLLLRTIPELGGMEEEQPEIDQVAPCLKAGREVEFWECNTGSAQARVLCVHGRPLCHTEAVRGLGSHPLETLT